MATPSESLTKLQRNMLDICLSGGETWATSKSSPNHKLLLEWEAMGWTEQIEPPSSASFLVCFKFTAAGISALKDKS